MQNIDAKFNPEDGSVQLWDVKTVVKDQELEEVKLGLSDKPRPYGARPDGYAQERKKGADKAVTAPVDENAEPVFNPKTDIMLSDAKVLKMSAKVGDVLRTELPVPGEFGRMAAMTAKQVIMQKLREAEREVIYNEYKEREGEMVMGTIQRREGRNILVDLGSGTAMMKPEDQVPGERYYPGDRIKAIVKTVSVGAKGSEINLSRAPGIC